ncbi:MAG: CBS domain-containing protein [Candidatus Micrarchaeia archaeon]|jgi:signal-transduction protein with cAMP-binding, CBS, and nucleotidyltransferase domain
MALFDNIKNAVSVEYDENISKAISKLEEIGYSLVVTKNGKYHGLIDDREIKQRSVLTDMKVGTLSVKAPVLRLVSTPLEAAKLFTTGKFKALAVIDTRNKPIGIITRADLLRELASANLLVRGKAKDAMGVPAYTVEAGESVAQARSKMRKLGITHLIVMENGKALGTFTTYDAVKEVVRPRERVPLAREKFGIDSQPVRSFFRRIDSTTEEASLRECALKMAKNDISEMAVERDGKPIGIIVANDIFKMLTKSPEAMVEVSGLDEEDRGDIPEIVDMVRKTLSKFGQPLEYISLNVKKQGHKYSVKAHTKGKRVTGVSSSGWDLYGAVRGTLKELRRAIMRDKPDRMHGGKRREVEE